MLFLVRTSLRAFALGFLCGTLLAPRAGAETRRLLAEKLVGLVDQALEIGAVIPGQAAANGARPHGRAASREARAGTASS